MFPVTHGCLFYPGMAVLPTHTVYNANRLAGAELDAAKDAWRRRLLGVFDEPPIPFRRQNGGDYPDGHTLGEQVAADASGLRTCSKSAALQRYGVKNKLKMLMYHKYIPLFRLFSPCLALARETLNRF
ncbi:hypothetical protein [Chromobacterium sp. LK11]|uniref:hypothetical protein n=1 Tax=Chromobacterium sp. LK11 TaxID=1628212 RepID=UPI00069F8E7C|nr:hypothetical protein [Chromobacterium sp. LK11]